jgi:hypothetical protein
VRTRFGPAAQTQLWFPGSSLGTHQLEAPASSADQRGPRFTTKRRCSLCAHSREILAAGGFLPQVLIWKRLASQYARQALCALCALAARPLKTDFATTGLPKIQRKKAARQAAASAITIDAREARIIPSTK